MLERLNGLQRATLVLTAIITAMSAAAPLFPVLSRTFTGSAYNMAVLTAANRPNLRSAANTLYKNMSTA